jgi:ABC-2 type transport system ATP-binding protein
MRQKLALARAMLHEPSILLLDEPTSAMDPSSAKIVRESIFGLRSIKRAIIVCTHNLAEAEILADRIAIIQHGKIIVHGTPEELKQNILGSPIMKVVLAQQLNGVEPKLTNDVKVLEYGPNWICYQVASPHDTNPAVIAALGQAGFDIVTLSQVGRSLEEVYLEVVRNNVTEMDLN